MEGKCRQIEMSSKLLDFKKGQMEKVLTDKEKEEVKLQKSKE